MAIDAPFAAAASTARRAQEIFSDSLQRNYRRTDRMFAILMGVQWIGGILAALVVSPRTWAGIISSTHIHVWSAILIGGAIAAFPIVLALTFPGRAVTRHVIATGQMLASALLIHLTGGRIETHFHVFGSLAFLAFYRDWRVLITATAVVAVDHFVRGVYFPQSVYGVLTASGWRWFEHAGWVIFEDIVLVLSCRAGVRELRNIAGQRAELEVTNHVIEERVQQRTAELETVNRQLEAHKGKLERLNAALEEASRRAEAASHAKSAFLANMSHEIRTPMTAILGFSDLLIEPHADPSDRVNAAHVIRRNGEHLLSLINDILDLSKIEAGKLEVERTDCFPGQIITDTLALFSDRAAEKGLQLRAELVTPVPERICSDPVRVKQSLVNLVGNALKFTASGSINIRVSCAPEEQMLTFDVVDSGVGIAPDKLATLFQPFTQADASTTRRFGGTGLGLSITKSLAELLGGKLTATSVAGQGSTFTLQVATGPLAGVPNIARLNAITPAEEKTATAAQLPTLDGRILLVEDGPDNQRLISFVLRRAGAEVVVANDGQEGVIAALHAVEQQRPFGLILMDMQMPVMDGYTATRTLRGRRYQGQIVALTAHAMKGEQARCLEAGCDAYLPKPISRPNLLREVAARMNRTSEKFCPTAP